MTAALRPDPRIQPAAPPGRAPAAITPAAGAIRHAGEHFAAATLYLVAAAIGLVWIAPDLAAGLYLSPRVAGVTHLVTLGWITMTIFGALHQLLPVALDAPMRNARLGHVSFAVFAPGVGFFAGGVANGSMVMRHLGIALVATGVLLTVGNVATALRRARRHDATWAAIALAITFLTSTLGFGVLLLHNLHTGFLGAARVHILAAHLHVAVLGWALIMIVGVSHRLLPMFLLAHGADARWTRRSLSLLAAGVPILAVGLTMQLALVSWAGAALLELGLACFIRQAYEFYRVRVKRTLDVGMRFAATAIGFQVVTALFGVAVLADGSNGRIATAYVTIGLLGGIVLFIVGFFYKIVPLLAWTAHYSGRMGKERVPTVTETFSTRVAQAQLALMAAAIALLGLGIVFGSTHVTRCGAVLFLGGVLLFSSQIARVALGPAK